ncbi:MAG: pilin biogenesis protein [Candidatus Moranbacteria bacterium GW2011_GWC2_37_8]|nr:MAG: pilin biogenesis protein [Candidatus Moranbacteria bacterium GW2011_GWC2_37_8]KKQ62500.1 MAG: pilin biogenesis protein [Parcubacteria group bacterium GW2011_GWC1_38_22]KKQ81078.1 MAG: pilin biogenesis protein [Candidatus Moranbacteria bacterium GW2011_GWD2_38_7]
MKFSFQAKSAEGEIREGRIEATNSEAAVAMLQERGLVPLMLEKETEIPSLIKDLQHIWDGVNLRELSVFYRQLATLIEAKVSIISALRAVGDQSDNLYLSTVIKEMVNDIEDGVTFSESMSKHPEVFATLAVSMVKAGELSGNLQRSVVFLADNTEKNYELNAKIRGALFYPGFVLSASVIIGFVVFTVVLPKLTGIFKDFNVAIPWYTKMFMFIGDFMSSFWWVVGIILLAIVGGFFYYIKTEDGRKEWDTIKMKIPVIGKLFQYVYLARFSENLAVLLDGGIPIVRALVIVSEVVDSTSYESVILRAADEVKTGGSMSTVFARSSQFPPIVSQMVKIGEDAGKISEVLNNMSRFYNQETDRVTRNLSTMLEPILITGLGLGVGVLVFAILMPIYNIAGQVQ